MRRMTVAAVLLFLIVALCLYESGTIQKVISSNINELDEITANVQENDLDGAKEKFSLLKKKWTQNEDILDAITSHEDTDAVNLLLTELGENIRQNNVESSLMTIGKLRLQFEHIYKRNKIKISNIL